MKQRDIKNFPESVKNRLRNVATAEKKDFNLLLQYYAMERLLFRISKSTYSGRFVLKGALLLHALGGDLERSTRDVDFWSSVQNNIDFIRQAIEDCLQTKVPEDGIAFDPKSLEIVHSQFDSRDRGVHLELFAYMGTAEIGVRHAPIDI